MRGRYYLAQSCSILGPHVTIITGLVRDTRQLADTLLTSSRQNCSLTDNNRNIRQKIRQKIV